MMSDTFMQTQGLQNYPDSRTEPEAYRAKQLMQWSTFSLMELFLSYCDWFYTGTAFYYKRHKFTWRCIKANPNNALLASASYLMIEQRPVSIKHHWLRMKDKAYYMR